MGTNNGQFEAFRQKFNEIFDSFPEESKVLESQIRAVNIAIDREIKRENPVGAVFREMDCLASQIDGAFLEDHLSPRIDVIRKSLDDWVRRRVVRMCSTTRFIAGIDPDPDENLRINKLTALHKMITEGGADEFIDLCAQTSVEGDEMTVAFYIMAMKENF